MWCKVLELKIERDLYEVAVAVGLSFTFPFSEKPDWTFIETKERKIKEHLKEPRELYPPGQSSNQTCKSNPMLARLAKALATLLQKQFVR